MRGLIKYINVLILIISVIFIGILIKKSITNKDYDIFVNICSILIGSWLYELFDSKVIKNLKYTVKKIKRLKMIVFLFNLLLFICIFFGSFLIKNILIHNILEGLFIPSLTFFIRYWNQWMEDEEYEYTGNGIF